MSRRSVNITLDNLDDLPSRCRQCVFWELDPVAYDRAHEAGDTAFEKESWVSATLLDWGSCGKILYVDNVPAGFVSYAPPGYVPRSLAFPTSPISADAVLLMTAHVHPDFAGGGLGRILLQGVAKDLVQRGVRAIEAFGDEKWAEPACVLPADHLRSVGFKTVRPHHRFPRLRLELKTAVSWREDVEVALEKLLGSVSPTQSCARSELRALATVNERPPPPITVSIPGRGAAPAELLAVGPPPARDRPPGRLPRWLTALGLLVAVAVLAGALVTYDRLTAPEPPTPRVVQEAIRG